MIGQEILGYTIKEKIGSGGFGTVYRCEKINRSGVYVRALKHIALPTKRQYQNILNSMGGDYEKANEYFSSSLKDIIGEIQILNHLTEIGVKNVVSYYENQINEQANPLKYDIYILMEYLTSFSEYVEKNNLSVRDVIRLGKDILNALEACHDNQIIHRDIKDDNIFVGHDGTFKLGDFGVSKKLQDRFVAESVKGTLSYIAPEVYLKTQKYDYTVDLYSLGIVLYKLLNGNRIPFLPLFPKPYNNLDEERAFERRMKYEMPELPIDAENDLGQVIIKSLARRDKRYNSAKEFYTKLCEAEQRMTNEDLNKIVTFSIENEKSIKNTYLQKSSYENSKMFQKEMSGDECEETVGLFDMIVDAEVEKTKDDFMNGNRQPERKKEDSGKHNPQLYSDEFEQNDRPSEQESRQEKYFSDIGNGKHAVQRKNFGWIFYLIPVGIVIVYILIYIVFLPHLYDKTISIADWLIKNPKAVIDELQSSKNDFTSLYKIIFWRLLNYAFFAGFIISLYLLGRKIHYAKPKESSGALLIGREPYYMIMESYEAVKRTPAVGMEVHKAIKTVHDRLKNETDFGYGNVHVIKCENEIEHLLQTISSDIVKLNNRNTIDEAKQEIVSACHGIMTKLKIRAELKKNK